MNKFLRVIQDEQRPDGSFPSWSALVENWGGGQTRATTFFTSLILGAGNTFKNEKLAIAIYSKACHFLLSQKSSNWTWNYWQKNTPEFKRFFIPADLDDTFCAAGALHLHDQKKIPAPALAKLIQLLTSQEAEAAVGGPYRTWVVPDSFSNQWQDIDLAVNCNIAYFLSFYDIHLANITKLIEQAITTNNYTSPYYASPYPVLYFISRVYKGPNKNKIISFIKSKRKTGTWGNSQDTALAVNALLNLGAKPGELKNSIQYLSALPTKAISAHPFCMDPQQEGQKFAAGSKAFTAALILETLTKYQQKIKSEDNATEKFYLAISQQLYKDAAALRKTPLKKTIIGWIDQILGVGKDHKIILVSYWTTGKITGITKLAALATFYGWMAYLLQDKMLDGDAGSELIPVTNYFYRQLNSVVIQMKQQGTHANQLLNNFCQTMDEANDFELRYLKISKSEPITLPKIPMRYRQHKLLADKSIGFAFGPVLLNPGLEKFFHHYLIARQLNDDAHDWEEDLKNGRLNSVSIILMSEWQKLNPNKSMTLNNAAAELRPLFWNSVIVKVAKQISDYCEKALKQNEKLVTLITPLQSAANQAITQKQQAQALLKIFK